MLNFRQSNVRNSVDTSQGVGMRLPRVKQSQGKEGYRGRQKGISRSVAAGTPEASEYELSKSGSQELIAVPKLAARKAFGQKVEHLENTLKKNVLPMNHFTDSNRRSIEQRKHNRNEGGYHRSQADLIGQEIQRIERESSERFERAVKGSHKACLSQ